MPITPRKLLGRGESRIREIAAMRETPGRRMLRLVARPLCTLKRTTAVAPISTAVTQTSPSPWAKWPSPVENSAPLAKTGRNSLAPLVNCLTSKLPPFSRGGRVRRPARPQGPPGTAPAGLGGSTKPPVSSARCSRAVHSSSFCADGATAGNAHERRAGDAHAGKLGRGGPAVADLPMHQERRRSSRRAESPSPA